MLDERYRSAYSGLTNQPHSGATEKTMTTYAIDDGQGTNICGGLQEHNARKIAQQIANERGESVYLYDTASADDNDNEEFSPEA